MIIIKGEHHRNESTKRESLEVEPCYNLILAILNIPGIVLSLVFYHLFDTTLAVRTGSRIRPNTLGRSKLTMLSLLGYSDNFFVYCYFGIVSPDTYGISLAREDGYNG